MPNHCFNTLSMSEDVLPFIIQNYIRDNEQGERIFDFERIEPVGETQDWHKYRIEKWGTRSVGYDLNIGESIIDFFTAWSPPVYIIKKLAELYKDFDFRLEYYETGMAFRGVATAKWKDSGVVFEDNYWDMTPSDFEELGLM
jgi:hypothetical protein